MCRWIAYNGGPIFLDRLITEPDHSLVVQSLNSQLNFNTAGQLLSTNGDGFGVGWYDRRRKPGLFRDDLPAWHNTNLQSLCHQVEANTFLAHVRATTTGDIQRTNCHPFCYKNWLFQHNGHVTDFAKIRRSLQMAIDPEVYPHLQGTTDSETFFLLAVTYGLLNSPKKALQKMVRKVEEELFKIDSKGVLNLSCAISDGTTLYTLRYSRNEGAMTQFVSADRSCLEEFDGGDSKLPENSTVVVSEPLDSTSDKWTEVPENSFVTIRDGNVNIEKLMDD